VVFGRDGRTCEGVVLEYLNTNVKGPRKIINQEHKKTNRPDPPAVPLPLRCHMYNLLLRARGQTLPVPLLANGTLGDTNSQGTIPPPRPHIPQTRRSAVPHIPHIPLGHTVFQHTKHHMHRMFVVSQHSSADTFLAS